MRGRAMRGRWMSSDVLELGLLGVLHSLGAIDRIFCSSNFLLLVLGSDYRVASLCLPATLLLPRSGGLPLLVAAIYW